MGQGDRNVASASPETSVRDSLTRYPSAEQVFERHGLLGCGGPNAPQEPIGLFAGMHHVEPAVLVRELNAHLTTHPEGESLSAPGRPVTVVYRGFIVSSLIIAVVAGFTTGIAAITADSFNWGIRGVDWHILIQTHGRLQLYGWAASLSLAWPTASFHAL
jgi:hypothetical protein